MLTVVVVIAVFISVASLVGGVALLVRGEAASPVEDRLEVLTGAGGGKSGREGAPAEPSLLAQPLDDTPSPLETLCSRVLNLRVFLDQAGSPLAPSKFLLLCGGLGCVGGIVWILAGIYPGGAPAAALLTSAVPFVWMFLRRKRRLATFARQLPEALDLIARALRAGHSLAAGLKLVAEELGDPIGKEFARCYDEQHFGIPLEDALEDMADRVPNLDLRFFVTAVVLQRQTGGDLAEILDKIGALVRERFKIWGQVQALTGEGRLSGIVLLALPPVLAVVVYRLNPSYVMMLFEDPLGQKMLAGAVIMQILGAIVIRKIVNIKV